MTLEQFIEMEIKLLAEFKSYWESHPEYPSTLWAGEWDEQFNMFTGTLDAE